MAPGRRSDDLDFSAPDGHERDDEPSPLRRLVLAQTEEPGGAAVRLLTTSTPAPWSALAGAPEAARALGLDPDTLAPFSPDAYLLQSALGELALGDQVPSEASAPGDGLVVACNYHEIPAEHRGAVRERLLRLRDLGPVLDPADLADVSAGEGARVVVGFYDAYRDAALFGAELCHELGLRAWFFPLLEPSPDEPGSGALTDAELADIATAHELCFHTASHTRAPDVDEATLQHQVLDAHARLTELAGRPPRLGAWLGGSRYDPDLLGNQALRDLGLTHLVSNWSVEALPGRPATPAAPATPATPAAM